MRVPISAIEVAASPREQDVFELARFAGLQSGERERLAAGGLRRIPVSGKSTAALALEALDAAVGRGWDPVTGRVVAFTHSLELSDSQMQQITQGVSALCTSLELRPLLLSGQPCSILHLGIAVAASVLTGHARQQRGAPDDSATAAVVGADVAPTVDDRFFFGSAMGDAAAAMVLGGQPELGTILATVSSTHVVAPAGVHSSEEQIARFRAENPTAVRATLDAALAAAGVSRSDLKAIVPHTPYRTIWDTVSTLCRIPRHRIFDDYVQSTGHLNASDVLVHYRSAIDEGRLQTGDVVALLSPGFGGTRGCTVIQR